MKIFGSTRARNGLTLIELVIVVVILGILAAVVAPKLTDIASEATDNGLRHTLAAIRDVIDAYQSQNGGALPGQSSDLPGDLAPYLRDSTFPKSSVSTEDAMVAYPTGSPVVADPVPLAGWKYSTDAGEFISNSGSPTASDAAVNYDEI